MILEIARVVIIVRLGSSGRGRGPPCGSATGRSASTTAHSAVLTSPFCPVLFSAVLLGIFHQIARRAGLA